MGFRLPGALRVKQLFQRSAAVDVPKGYCAVYVGENQKEWFLIPVSYLNRPSFQDLLSQAEEDFSYDHNMSGLTIPYTEDVFVNLTHLRE
ncbi:hypothetical protein FNV43_RR21689 [Rhamnella rubrinervis]|uniref:Uncharacterized protein n=1 Tax=Rhamnella rubrinervis TaxID=2594499 RepID=A0A8K0GQC9_9ROSA|nr:hypothetical protein FNV43_RR21689 [Rhamnella rubrinervis]